jgi:hypothetical protein
MVTVVLQRLSRGPGGCSRSLNETRCTLVTLLNVLDQSRRGNRLDPS